MNVRHGEAGMLDARQEGDVGDLLGRLIFTDLLDQLLAGEDVSIHAHARLVTFRNAVAARADLLERTAKRFLGHEKLLQISTMTSASHSPSVRSTRKPW